ncbi:MAG TPA: hypothetical protein DIT67_00640 [Octadecabacter sp.]|mgnify:CR=1 FL=1|nr:hypothetical protein [Octadecabacter sp.]
MNAKESAGIPHLSQDKKTKLYRYQRRVPKDAWEAVGRKVWDRSLGAHYGAAVDRARALNTEHDALLEHLATPEDRAAHIDRKQEEIAAMAVRMQPGMKMRFGSDGELEKVPPMDRNPGQWKQTPDKMKRVRALPPEQELQQLAYFAAYAFGDREKLDLVNDKSPLGDALTDVMRPQRPDDPTDAIMFDAMKTALDARFQEVGGKALVNPKHTLTYLHEKIADLRNSKPNTIRNHKVTTAKFTKFLKDEKGLEFEPSLATIDEQLLQDYLDYLLEDPNIGRGTVHKYFDGMNSVFRHAIRNKKVPGLVVNPIDFVEMPKPKPVDESMFLPFDREEIKRVWEEAQKEWSPNNRKSKLSQGRRSAFLMCFRVLLYSGLRPQEVFWLRDHGGVTAEYIDAKATKTSIRRFIPLSDHIADFHSFFKDGGFEACTFEGKFRGEAYGTYNPEKTKEAMRRSFSEIRKSAKITERRKVLYSTKDTLLQRLRSVEGYSGYMEVCVTGHVKQLEKGRHYGGILGDDEGVRAMVKKGLDQITYW